MEPAGSGLSFGFEQMLESIATESRTLSDAVARSDLEARFPRAQSGRCATSPITSARCSGTGARTLRPRMPTNGRGGDLTAFPEDADLLAWLGWCTYTLLGALRDAGPDAPCWTWWPEPHTSGAVARHQAQEVAVHRWDAEGVAGPGASEPLAAGLATDGVPEFVDIMVGADRGALPGTVTLTATDTGASWQITGDAGVGRPGRESELRATASELVLMLYRRLPVPDSHVVGDPVLVAALLSLADTS